MNIISAHVKYVDLTLALPLVESMWVSALPKRSERRSCVLRSDYALAKVNLWNICRFTCCQTALAAHYPATCNLNGILVFLPRAADATGLSAYFSSSLHYSEQRCLHFLRSSSVFWGRNRCFRSQRVTRYAPHVNDV